MRWNIGLRLGLLLASFSILAALLVGYFTFAASRDMLNDRAQRALLSTTQILSRHLQSGFATVARDTTMLATLAAGMPSLGPVASPEVQAQDTKVLADVFRSVLQARPGYLQVRLISAREHRLEQVRVERQGGRVVRAEEAALQEKGHYPFVFETLRLGQGEVYVTEFGINHEGLSEGPSQPIFSVAAPVVRDGVVAGVVVVRLDADHFLGNFSAGLPAPYGFYLTNRWGDFLVHPDRNKTFGFDRGQRILAQDQFPGVERLVSGSTTEAVIAHMGSDDEKQALALVRMPFGMRDDGRFLLVGLSQPMSVVQAEALELGRSIVKMVSILCLVGLLLASWVSRVVTDPLKAMVRATEAFSQGRAHGALPVERHDELGELARSFRDMEQQIGQQMVELNRSRDAMAHLAHHDPLTGLPNRRMFEQRLERALEMSRRSGRACALVFVDLDDFKSINDKLGHAVGDAVLQAAARVIVGAVRQVDTVARLAGDEFTVLCENVDTQDAALQVLEKLQQAFEPPLLVDGKPLAVRASMGVSLFPNDAEDAQSLLASADAAMYRAKQRLRVRG